MTFEKGDLVRLNERYFMEIKPANEKRWRKIRMRVIRFRDHRRLATVLRPGVTPRTRKREYHDHFWVGYLERV